MADLLNFGGFIKKTLQRREADAEKQPEPAKQDSTESQPTMSQGDFSYGPEGMRRVKKPNK